MSTRIRFRQVAPGAAKALDDIHAYLAVCGLDSKLRLLVEIRVSQINGCAYCVDRHIHEARTAGEMQQRLDCLAFWRETPFFDARERAALAWTESLTLVGQSHARDDVYAQARDQFDDKTLVDLTLAIGGMNAWNRIIIGFGLQPTVRK